MDADDHVQVPPEAPTYQLRRVWLTGAEEQGYYYGFANEGMWPLCHVAHVRPVFRESDWQRYREVNERFAEAVAAEARTEDPIVLVQDYHFALAPRMIRERLLREGAEIGGNSPAEFDAFVKSETAKWAKVVKLSGAKAE